MYINKNSHSKLNLGIQILRIIFSFWIVTVHCYSQRKNENIKLFYKKMKFHVPTFIFISFYFYYNKLIKRDITKITQRIVRLLIPYIIWPFIFLIINNFCHILFDFQQFRKKLTFHDYFVQLVIGRGIYSYFWYINVTLFSTFIFTIISYIFYGHFLFIIQLLGLISYRIHLSSFYANFDLKEKYFSHSNIILFIEMIPSAVLGLTFGSKNITDNLKNHYIKHIIIHIIFLYFLFKLNIFQIHEGYLYSGIEINTIGAINSFIIFSLFPFEKCLHERIICIIKNLSSYTGGIYYLHVILHFYLAKIIIFIKNRTLSGCIIIYLFCYFICFIGSRLFKKSILNYLFI